MKPILLRAVLLCSSYDLNCCNNSMRPTISLMNIMHKAQKPRSKPRSSESPPTVQRLQALTQPDMHTRGAWSSTTWPTLTESLPSPIAGVSRAPLIPISTRRQNAGRVSKPKGGRKPTSTKSSTLKRQPAARDKRVSFALSKPSRCDDLESYSQLPREQF